VSTVTRQRLDVHNVNVNSAAAAQGLCGFTHLASGRVCRLPSRHSGACAFDRPSASRSALKRERGGRARHGV